MGTVLALGCALGGQGVGPAPAAAVTAACDAYFQDADGTWSDVGNWYSDSGRTTPLGHVPGTGEHPCWGAAVTVDLDTTATVDSIPSGGALSGAGTLTLTSAGNASSLTGLTVVGAKLHVGGPLTVTGDISLTAGATPAVLDGAGTLTQSSGHQLAIDGASLAVDINQIAVHAEGSTITLAGELDLCGCPSSGNVPAAIYGHDLVLGDGSSIIPVNAGGGFTLDGTLQRVASGTHAALINVPIAFTAGGIDLANPAGGGVTFGIAGSTAAITGSPAIAIGASTSLKLSGGTVAGGAVTGAGTLVLNGSTTTLASVSGVTVTGKAGTTTVSGAFSAGTFTQTGGALTVSGSGGSVPGFAVSGGTLTVDGALGLTGPASVSGNATLTGGGTITQSSGGFTVTKATLSQVTLVAGSPFAFNDAATVASGAQLSAATVTVGTNGVITSGPGGGTLTVSSSLTPPGSSTTSLGIAVVLTSGAALSLSSGTTLTTGPLSTSGAVTVGSGAGLVTAGATQTGGTATVDGQVNGAWQLAGGTLGGTGTLSGAVTNAGGTLAPGHSPGRLTVGSYQQSSGTLALDVTGQSPVTSYDQLAISGSTAPSLSGTIAVSGGATYSPPAGSRFAVISCAACSGSPTVTNLTVSDDLAGPVHYTADAKPGELDLLATSTPTGPSPTPSPTPSPDPSGGATPSGAPGAPTAVRAAAGDRAAVITFAAPALGPVSSYVVSVRGPAGTITQTAAGSPATVTGLTNGQPYTVTVQAGNDRGLGPASDPASVTPRGLPGPVRITGWSPAPHALTIGFTAANPNGASVLYRVTARPSTGHGRTVTATVSRRTATVRGLAARTTYLVRVRAVNAAGLGAASKPITARTGPRPAIALAGVTTTHVGRPVTFTGTATIGGSPAAGRTLSVVLRRAGVAPQTLRRFRTDASGRFSLVLVMRDAGLYDVTMASGPVLVRSRTVRALA